MTTPGCPCGQHRGSSASGHYSGRMPRKPVPPDALPALGAALEGLRDGARDGADEVLSHYPELGDRETQSALETYLDQVADLLREVEASCAELSDAVRLAGHGAQAVPPRATHPVVGPAEPGTRWAR